MATILIVDDRPSNRSLLIAILRPAGHHLLEAGDGVEALAIARSERPDLVLADILMPTMDGYELVRRLRSTPETLRSRVIFCTAHFHEAGALALARSCGVTRVLLKPCEPETVLDVVNEVLAQEEDSVRIESPPPEFDRQHLQLITDKLSQKTNELRQANARLSSLVELGLQLANERSPRKLLQALGNTARSVIGARYAIVGVLNGGDHVASLLTAGMGAAMAAAIGSPSRGSGPVKIVLSERRCVRLQNDTGDPVQLGLPSTHPNVHSWLGAPLVSPTGVYGWLSLIDKLGLGEFNEEDERLAGILAAQVGRLYESALAYADMQRHVSHLEQEAVAQGPGAAAAAFVNEFPDAMMVVTPDAKIVAWTGGAERLFGYSADEVIGRKLGDVLVRARGRNELEAWDAAVTRARPAVYEATCQGRDGSTIQVDATVRPICGPDGTVRFLAISKKDISHLHYRREAGILEARYRGLLDAAPDAMVIINKEGRILLFNNQTLRLFGYDRDELIGEPVEILVPERFRTNHPAHRQAYASDPRPRPMGVGVDLAALRKDGTEFPSEISLSPIQFEGGGVYVAAAIRDVTARRKTETKFRGLLDATPDAIVIVDAAGRIELVNAQAVRLFGYARDELVGKTVDLLVPLRFRDRHPGYRNAYFADPRTRSMGEGIELAALRKDGTEFPAEISLSPVETDDGFLVTAAVRDVTERKRLEQKKVEEREEHNRRLQEASRLKSEFLANMSHELRTPLNAIIGFSKLLYKGTLGPMEPTHREHVGDILTSSMHLLQLINDVLDLSKVEAGKMEFRPEMVDLAKIMWGVCETMQTLALQRQISLHVEASVDLGPVKADPQRLKQILYNFLSNALKFSHDGGRVVVRTKPQGTDRFRLEVQDEGIGIAPEDLQRLFVEFQQLDASAAKRHQGTGLGLALTRRLVNAQGGEVGVESTPGRGSTFFAILPLVGISSDGQSERDE